MSNDYEMKDGILFFTANLYEEDIELFEGFWPVPHGVSINSYLVKGEKSALIDLSYDGASAKEQISAQLKEAGVDLATVDYLVLNHLEPDHTGTLPELLAINPGIEIICTEKAAKLVAAFYGEARVRTVKTGDKLDLGAGKVLSFLEIPNVHWPETMATYEESQKVLFSCDAFGGFGALEDSEFDDELQGGEKAFYKGEALRYYVNIVGSFSNFVNGALEKIEKAGLDISVVAPSHGLVWRKNPREIFDWYRQFASYMEGPADPSVTLVWSSMYGNTGALVDSIVEGVRSENVDINIFRVPQDHVSFILPEAYRSAGLILGMPTYEYKMFPPMSWAIDIFSRKHVWNKHVLRFGSYGWSGGAQKELTEMADRLKLKWTFADPVEWQGRPTEEVKRRAFEAGADFAREIKEKAGGKGSPGFWAVSPDSESD